MYNFLQPKLEKMASRLLSTQCISASFHVMVDMKTGFDNYANNSVVAQS